MRRRRRFKGTWFPTLGTNWEADTGSLEASSFNFVIQNPAGAEVDTRIFPLTNDTSGEGTTFLNDSLGQEYALRRIVGKIHIFPAYNIAPNYGTTVKVAAGFLVARGNDNNDDIPLGVNLATSSTATAAGRETYNSFSPLAKDTVREPWIWRRTWILGPAAQDAPEPAPGLFGFLAPYSNFQYGSVLDGPHIDAKTRRRIRQDERLYFAISSTRWPYGTDDDQSVTMNVDLDIRLFGAMRRARNQGAF